MADDNENPTSDEAATEAVRPSDAPAEPGGGAPTVKDSTEVPPGTAEASASHLNDAVQVPGPGAASDTEPMAAVASEGRAGQGDIGEFTPLVGLPLPPFATADPQGTSGAVAASGGAGGPGGPGAPGAPGAGGLFSSRPGEGGGSNRSHRHLRARAGVAAAVLLAGGLGAGLGAAFGPTSPTSAASPSPTSPSRPASPGRPTPASQAPNKVSGIATAVETAVVNINTDVVTGASAAGTGMIVTSGGEVLTNNHVIEDATSIKVSITGRKGSYAAKVIATDPTADVALLQLEGVSGLPVVHFASTNSAKVGDAVIAIGNAGGLGGTQTVVPGSITALGRSINASDEGANSEHLTGLLQTDAPIVPGDSGGPLVNYSGRVVGMDTAAETVEGSATIGFAIPSATLHSVVSTMQHRGVDAKITYGESAFLGVGEEAQTGPTTCSFGFYCSGSTGTGSSQSGVTIEVVPSGPAAKAGLSNDDVITSIGGTAIKTWTDLENAVAKYKPGDTVKLTYLGIGVASTTIEVTLGGIPK